jgi:hypothetical protein
MYMISARENPKPRTIYSTYAEAVEYATELAKIENNVDMDVYITEVKEVLTGTVVVKRESVNDKGSKTKEGSL